MFMYSRMTGFLFSTIKSTGRNRWVIITSVIFMLAMVVFLILRGINPTVIFLPANEMEIGGYGPVELRFSQPMQVDSVAQHFNIQPAVHGRQVWQGQTFWFWPEESLTDGGSYQVNLSAGSKSIGGQVIQQSLRWTIRVRPAQILYLSPLSGSSEIWENSLDGKVKKQLTLTGGKVVDFAPARSGESVAYSIKNQQGGIDLWLVDRNGQGNKKILDCGVDWCNSPSWSPEGEQIAYSRTQKGSSNTGSTTSRIWQLDLSSGQAAPLFNDPKVTGTMPSWSPDGLRIASFDNQAGGTRVFDLQTKQDIILHSSEGQIGSWSFDGKKMLFIDSNPADLNPHDHIYEANFEIQANHPLPDPVSAVDVIYSVPELAPDGNLLAIGLRYADGPISKQIWLMGEDGTQAHPLTENQVFNQAAYSWDPFGKALVYQRLELGSSQTRPEVVIWQRDSGNFVTAAKDAGQPRWLP